MAGLTRCFFFMGLIKKPKEIEQMRVAGKILAGVLARLIGESREGVSLLALDQLAQELTVKQGGESSFLGYRPEGAARPYPKTICASLNNVIVHGVPTSRKLKNGDLLKLDLGVKFNGYHADAALTLAIGKVTPDAQKLLEVTRAALNAAISAARAGGRLHDIGFAVESVARSSGFFVATGLTGHGIGRRLHESPSVPNEGKSGTGMVLRPGMVLALEPMLNIGTAEIRQLADESYGTADGQLSAHFEHTILITRGDAEILTSL